MYCDCFNTLFSDGGMKRVRHASSYRLQKQKQEINGYSV